MRTAAVFGWATIAVVCSVVLLLSLAPAEARADPVDRITHIDGIGTFERNVFGGYVTVNQAYGANMYYLFFESQGSPTADPVIVWLQGGPGCASVWGAFVENGPYRVTADGQFVPNPNTWNLNASMLYIDQPVGAGFSYVENQDGYVRNETTMAQELYTALSTFFSLHPQYASNPLFIFGESYAGKYIPSIAAYIVEDGKLPLRGIGIGNGLVNPSRQIPMDGPYLYNRGLITAAQLIHFNAGVQQFQQLLADRQYAQASRMMWTLMQQVADDANITNPYNIAQKTDPTAALSDALDAFLARPNVAAQFRASGRTHWQDCSQAAGDALAADVPRSVEALLPRLLASMRVLVYNGMLDLVCNHDGTTAWLNSVPWPGRSAFLAAPQQPFAVQETTYGSYRHADSLTQVLVTEAGHLSPFDQPVAVLAMVQRFVQGQL